MSQTYLYPEYEAGKHLFGKQIEGAIVNLNLIRLRQWADYTACPHLQPAAAITGWDAFMLYVKEAAPFLEASCGEILFMGKGDRFLIGPGDERWDICMLVRQNSVRDFFNFEQNEAYMQIAAHRMAAIEDARLLPLEELAMYAAAPYSAPGAGLLM